MGEPIRTGCRRMGRGRAALGLGLPAMALGPALCISPWTVAETTTSLSVGTEFLSGDYGLDGNNVDEVYAPVTLDVRTDSVVVRATVPYAWVHGPEGSVLVSGTALPGEGPDVSQGGMGDLIGSVTAQNVYRSPAGGTALDLTGTVKLGTADENKGLGTGENDYAVQLDTYRFLGGGTVFVSVGYKWRGDPPGVDLKDTWFARIGGATRLTVETTVGASWGYRPGVVSSADPASDVTVYLARRLSRNTEVSAHVLGGLTDASADWGAGLAARFWF